MKSKVINMTRVGSWEAEAERDGYVPPPVISGIKIVNFCYLSPSDLVKNIDLINWQPRVTGVTPEKKEILKREIDADGLKNALVVWKQPMTGKYVPLTHHRLEAVDELDYKTAPCFVVEVTHYNDGTRDRQVEEILKEYVGAGPNCLNRPETKTPLALSDYVRELNDKKSFGHFNTAKDPDSIKKAASDYIDNQWGFLAKGDRKKVLNRFVSGVYPKKIEQMTADKMRKIYPEVPKKNKPYCFETNVIEAVCHSGSFLTILGPLMENIQKIIAVERKNGTPESKIKQKLSEVSVVIWFYVDKAQNMKAQALRAKRKQFVADCMKFNKWDLVPLLVTEINMVPQILEPKKETSHEHYKWNKNKGTF